MTLEQLRKRIDRLDRKLLRLLNERAAVALQIGHWKHRQKQPIFDGKREESVLRRMTRSSGGPLSVSGVRSIFREILRTNRHLQNRSKD